MIIENSISSFLNSRSMTKIDTFKLEFLKPKPSLTNSIFVELEEKQNLKNATTWRKTKPEERNTKEDDLVGEEGRRT